MTNKANKQELYDIQKRAVLVDIRIGTWGINKIDRPATQELKIAKNVKGDYCTVRKVLADHALLTKIKRIATSMRKVHYIYTMPWNDGGQRILPIQQHKLYKQEMDDYIEEFNNTVKLFVNDFPSVLNDAEGRLGVLYDIRDYPTSAQLEQKFSVELKYSPIEHPSHFLVQISANERSEIQKNMEATFNDKVAGTVTNLYNRLSNGINHLLERMDRYEDTPEKWKIFKASNLNHLKGIAELLPDLNITNDDGINQMCADLRVLLRDVRYRDISAGSKDFNPEKRLDLSEELMDIENRIPGLSGVTDETI